MSTYNFDELMGSLLAHEDRINRHRENVDEKAFQVKGESSYNGKTEQNGGRGQNRGGFRGRGCGGGRGRGHSGGQRHFKSNVQCHYCKKFGHKESECWNKQKDDQKGAHFAENVDEESKLFMAYSSIIDASNGVWYVDSGCSNHMCGSKALFKELDETKKGEVRLEDDKPMQVIGTGTISIKTNTP